MAKKNKKSKKNKSSQKTSENFGNSLEKGLKYPWNKASKLWNILWVFLPIFGWFALAGYGKKIVRELILKQNKHLPAFGGFWNNFQQGVIIFVFFIPTWIVLSLINFIPFVGWIFYFFLTIFIIPWLTMNFFIKEKFAALWDIQKAFDVVFSHGKEYVFAFLKTIIFSVIYGLLSFVLVGIPAYVFGNMYFLAEFYKKFK